MTEPEDYKTEMSFIGKKIPTITAVWHARPMIEQLISALLPKIEAEKIYTKLTEALKLRAGLRVSQLVKLVCPDPSKGMHRVVIAIPLLRELFADELFGWGGGGGKGNKKVAESPLQTTLRRR